MQTERMRIQPTRIITMTNKQDNTMTCQAETCVDDTLKRPQSYRAPADVYETEEAFLVISDMPGTSSDEINISIEDKMLTIDAAVSDRYQGLGRMRHQEYGVGDFHRSFRIGDGIDAEQITAQYRDGILEVSLPKSAAVQPRKIDIRTN